MEVKRRYMLIVSAKRAGSAARFVSCADATPKPRRIDTSRIGKPLAPRE